MCTLGRYKEPERFLESLSKQLYTDLELIVVDQNDNNNIEVICKKYCKAFTILYKKVYFKGLSKARNYALTYVTGEIVAFPDDDCMYFENTLCRVAESFNNLDADCITGKYISFMDLEKESNSKALELNKYNVWMHSISFTVFLRKSAVDMIGYFDQNLGVGSGTPYGSGEETDYLIRGLAIGFKMWNINNIYIYHPAPEYSAKIMHKYYMYSYGRMHVLRKNKYNRMFIYLNLVWPLFKAICNIMNNAKRIVFWYQFKGRFDYLRREK